MKFKGKIVYIVLFLVYLLLFYILANACIGGVIFPFAFSMLFALAWANQKVWILAPAYILATSLSAMSFEGAIASIVTVFMLVVPYYIHVLTKKNMKGLAQFMKQEKNLGNMSRLLDELFSDVLWENLDFAKSEIFMTKFKFLWEEMNFQKKITIFIKSLLI